MSSRANVSKGGLTLTYCVYRTGGDGRRRQVSTRRFPTRRGHAVRVKAPALGAGSSPKAESESGPPVAMPADQPAVAQLEDDNTRSVIQINVRSALMHLGGPFQ